MTLYEEAAKISLGGLEVYRFGFFVMLGMLGAAGVIGFLCWARRVRRGTGPLLVLLCVLMGGICSRLAFCLMNQELGALMPPESWIRITGGGWSMMGLVGGVLLGAFAAARITRQKAGVTLDIAACALPVFMVLERLGEACVEDFDYSRRLSSTFLNGTILTFSDYDGYYLATWKLTAMVMAVLFPILIRDLIRSKKDGDTCLLFLMLFGSCSIILESLRYDRFLSITFVGLQHVMAAVYLAAGVVICALQAGRRWKKLRAAALISLPLMVGLAVGLEFALDRTTWNKLMVYVIYIAVAAAPAVMGIMLRRRKEIR